MKIRSIISFLALCMMATQFIACKKTVTNPSTSLPVTANSVAGDFTVGSFVSSGDQTSTFSGYAFTFTENGIITATKDNDTVSGTWKFDDSDNTELKISFPNAPLNELNKGWHVEDLTGDHMFLTDDSGADDTNDDHPESHSRLEFERD